MEIVYDEEVAAALHDRTRRPRPTGRCSSTSSSRTPSRSTSTRSPTAARSWSAGSWSTSRRPASTPVTRAARCRPTRLSESDHPAEIHEATEKLARELGVIGLMNVQYAIKGDHGSTSSRPTPAPRARSRSSARRSAARWRKMAAKVMLGAKLAELGFTEADRARALQRQGAGLPVQQVPGVDTLLGPEMRSTGEVMGIDENFGAAFAKAQLGAGNRAAAQGQGLHLGARRGQAPDPLAGEPPAPLGPARSWRPAAPPRPQQQRIPATRVQGPRGPPPRLGPDQEPTRSR